MANSTDLGPSGDNRNMPAPPPASNALASKSTDPVASTSRVGSGGDLQAAIAAQSKTAAAAK